MNFRRPIMVAVAILGCALFTGQAGGAEQSWWLNVFFQIDGEWRPGFEIDGWAPREYSSQSECAERKAFAEAECRATPLDYPARWFCSPDKPMSEPPQPLKGILC